MDIGFIGAGEMGCCLASKFIKLGHTVSMANSWGPASLKEITENIGAAAATIEEATNNKKVIVIAIPQKSVQYLPRGIFRKLPKDVIIVDTGNYYPILRDGVLPALDKNGIDSLWVQEQLGAPVVKVFNSILATSIQALGKLKGEKNRIAIAVSGDGIDAKEVVFKLVDDIGFDPFDIGDIHQSWQQQPGSPIYCRDIDLSTLKSRLEGLGKNWSEMREIILNKRSADEILMRENYAAYLKGLQ